MCDENFIWKNDFPTNQLPCLLFLLFIIWLLCTRMCDRREKDDDDGDGEEEEKILRAIDVCDCKEATEYIYFKLH